MNQYADLNRSAETGSLQDIILNIDNLSNIADNSLRSQLFDNQLLTYKQAAQYLSVSESYLRRIKNKGLVPFVLISDRGVRFRVCSLNHWIEKREVK